MTTIKKNFVEIFEILENNKDQKVKDVLAELLPLMESKQRDKNHEYRDGKLWIFCYYHKEWEAVDKVEYGSKKNTPTGYNTMCKVGVNCWTKQQRTFKSAKADLLNQIVEGSLKPEDLEDKLAELEAERDNIKPLAEFLAEKALEAVTEE